MALESADEGGEKVNNLLPALIENYIIISYFSRRGYPHFS